MELEFSEAHGDKWYLAEELAPHYSAVKRKNGLIELWTGNKLKLIAVISEDENWTAPQLCKLGKVSTEAFSNGVDFGEAQAKREIRSALGIEE
jgi:hypothetical protein